MSHRYFAVASAMIATIAAFGARPLAAQIATPAVEAAVATAPAVTPDSVPGTLTTVVVTAEPTRRPRGLYGRMRENEQLRRVIAMQDRRIAELRSKIAVAKANYETKEREITAIDDSAAGIRAQRIALEARLHDAELRTASVRDR